MMLAELKWVKVWRLFVILETRIVYKKIVGS